MGEERLPEERGGIRALAEAAARQQGLVSGRLG